MFHNPFEEKKKRSNSKEKQLPIVFADIHEKDSMIFSELRSSGQVELNIQPLKIGDYQISETIIERKTASDFISSMLSKRLHEQLDQMESFPEKILIIEGDFEIALKRTKLNPNAIKGFILSLIINKKIPIIFTKDYRESSCYIILLARQKTNKKIESSMHQRIPKTIKEQKQYILESFPSIGPIKSKELLERFSSLKEVFNSSIEDLEPILRIKAKEFKELIDSI